MGDRRDRGAVHKRHVTALEERLEEVDTEVRALGDWASPFHAVVAALRWALFWVVWAVTLGKFDSSSGDVWMQVGRTIYCPRDVDPDLRDPSVYVMVCHELGHRYDFLAHPVRYVLGYLLSGSTRATIEMRAYGLGFAAEYRVYGVLPGRRPDQVAEWLSGPLYFWAGDYEDVHETMGRVADDVLDGTLADAYRPDADSLPRLWEDQ